MAKRCRKGLHELPRSADQYASDLGVWMPSQESMATYASAAKPKGRLTFERMDKIAAAYLPVPRILHPWPDARFAVNHPRWEPSA